MNPRNDQATLDAICAGNDCDGCGPSWWGPRGCYEQAKSNYANGSARPLLPGNPGYLATAAVNDTRTMEDLIGQSQFGSEVEDDG